jgi:DNA-directed RNA polymerase specialized sigma24 family protein
MPEPKDSAKESDTKRDGLRKQEVLYYIELVNIIRNTKNKEIADSAFKKIVELMQPRLQQISRKTKIPGCTHQDIYQESLYALRYKAIKDYDQERSSNKDISPFDKFALLCIRRHLSTKLKASYQIKSKVWISSVSLDQDRNMGNAGEEPLSLADILPKTEGDVLSEIDEKENFKLLMRRLYARLSSLEKEVFALYIQRHSYEDIAEFINKSNLNSKEIDAKTVDNAVSRIKAKGKEIFDKYHEED